MRKVLIGLAVIAAIAAAAYMLVGRRSNPNAQPAAQTLPAVKAPSEVVAEGRVRGLLTRRAVDRAGRPGRNRA